MALHEASGISFPSIDISGFLSGSWIYVLIIGFVGLLLIGGVVVMIFVLTWNRKIELYENISGRGYVRVRTVRARRIKLGRAGQEILRTMGGDIFSAYGQKVARNTWAFAKGSDGYWYNFVHGDLDAKFGVLDIEPTDVNVRMFHLSIDKIADQDYSQKKGFIEKYGMHMIMFVTLIIFFVGMYVISGQIREGLIASNNPALAEKNKETADILNNIANKLDQIARTIKAIPEQIGDSGSGLVPANEG